MNIDINGNELTVNGESVMLTKSLMAVFSVLYMASHRVVTYESIQLAGGMLSTNAARQSLVNLRKRLSIFDSIEIVGHYGLGAAFKFKITSKEEK